MRGITFMQVNSFDAGDGIVKVDLCVHTSMDSLTNTYILGNMELLEDPDERDSASFHCDAWRRYTLNM
jgi:hypothetical protein